MLFILLLPCCLCGQQTPLFDSIPAESGGRIPLTSLGSCRIHVKEGKDKKNCTIREIGKTILVYEMGGSLHDMPVLNIEKAVFQSGEILYFDDKHSPVISTPNNRIYTSTAPDHPVDRRDENDTIIRTNGDTIRCRITKETERSIFYTENHAGKMLSKEFIQVFRSPGGWHQVMNDVPADSTLFQADTVHNPTRQQSTSWNYVPERPGTENEVVDYEALGRKDAREYYQGKGAFAGGVVSGILFPVGWFPAILIAAIPPVNIHNPENRNSHLLHSNPEYRKGFKKQAHKKKAGEVLGGFVGGILVDVGILLCL
jgi:hypothetical protein